MMSWLGLNEPERFIHLFEGNMNDQAEIARLTMRQCSAQCTARHRRRTHEKFIALAVCGRAENDLAVQSGRRANEAEAASVGGLSFACRC
jgi:hypothetical protein